MVGGVNNGWAVAMSLLGYERGEAAATMPIRFQGELDRLLLLAKERGVDQDPLIRQRLAWCYGKVQIMRYLGMRTLTRFLAGHHPGPDGAITKLYWSEYHRVVTELGVDILGAEALDADRAQAVERVPGRRRRRAELVVVVGRHVPQRPRRHDLRRVLADPAQHHRRDGARAAQGAEGVCRSSERQRAERRWGPGAQPPGCEGAEGSIVIRIAGAVVRHPRLWPVAVRQWRRTVPAGWWRQVAVPAGAGAASTSGSACSPSTAIRSADVSGADVVNYLAWCRDCLVKRRP